MIVVDASAAIDLLLRQRPARAIERALADHPEVHVPEHFHVEVLSTLRRLRLHAGLSEHAAQRALAALGRLRAVRYPVLRLAAPIWALRETLSAYDAAYLALAARLDARLVTTDAALAGAARAAGRLGLG